MKKVLVSIISLSGLLLMAGCSPLAPIQSTPITKYLLQDPITEQTILHTSKKSEEGEKNEKNRGNKKNGKSLMVSYPLASHWINTPEMAYQSQSSQINYFAENEWAATPPSMIQPIVAHALQHSGLYHAVVQGPFAANVDQRLDIRIIDMQQDFTQNPSVYRFVVEAQLVNEVKDTIMRSHRFSYTIPTSSNNPQGGVDAANKAIKEWIPQLIAFCRKSPVNT